MTSKIEQLIEEHNLIGEKLERVESFKLLDEIFEQLGSDTLEEFFDTLNDVTRGGADAGFSCFIYSAEILEFYKANQSDIVELISEKAEELGDSDIIKHVLSFNCLKDCDFSPKEVYEVLYSEDLQSASSSIIDALCWAVLEDLAFLADC